MSYRMQHGHLSRALADEDARTHAASDEQRITTAITAYHRTGRIPKLPPRLLELFTSRVFLRLDRDCRAMDRQYAFAVSPKQ